MSASLLHAAPEVKEIMLFQHCIEVQNMVSSTLRSETVFLAKPEG